MDRLLGVFYGCRGPLLVIVLAAATAAAQPVEISHDALVCWPRDQHPMMEATLAPPGVVQSAKVYFRAESYFDFYFVEALVHPDGKVEAVLPLAAPETERVVYYIEALTHAFESARTREWVPEVSETEECRRRDPMLALFMGDAPEIIVGAVRAAAPALPPGFLAAGIIGAAGGSGVGAVVIGAVVAGGAAGGVVVATSGDPPSATTTVSASSPTTSVPAGTTSSVPQSPSTTTATGSQTTTTSSSPTTTTTASSGTTTTSAGSGATTTTAPASTTTTSGASTTTSVPLTTTSVPPTTTTTSLTGADVTVSISSPSSARLAQTITYSVVVSNNGPLTATSVRVTVSLPLSVTLQSTSGGSCRGVFGAVECDFATLTSGASTSFDINVLTLLPGPATATASVTAAEVDPAPGNNSASATTHVSILLRRSTESALAVTVHLAVPPHDGSVRGELTLGSRHVAVDGASPVELRASAEPGEHAVEAVLVSAHGRAGLWRFDFRAAHGFADGSLRVDTGEVLALEPRAVVFRLRGEVGERMRFVYRVTEP